MVRGGGGERGGDKRGRRVVRKGGREEMGGNLRGNRRWKANNYADEKESRYSTSERRRRRRKEMIRIETGKKIR